MNSSPRKSPCPTRPRKRRSRGRSDGLIGILARNISKERTLAENDHTPMDVDAASTSTDDDQSNLFRLSSQAKVATERILNLLAAEFQPNHLILNELKESLAEACKYAPIEAIASHADIKGYDMMQRSIIANCAEFVEFLLIQGYHISNLNRNCTNPLHLACKLGNYRIVRLLIDYGANLNELSTACYPPLHPSLSQVTLCCMGNSKTSPIGIAVMHDNLEVVNMLINHDTVRAPTINFDMLTLACKHKAEKCLKYFTNLVPELCTLRDRAQQSLLSLAFSKSEKCGTMLLKAQSIKWPADILTNVNGKCDTILHLIYRGEICEDFFDDTNLILSKGFPLEAVDCKDRNGTTPLQVLMKQVGRKVVLPHHTNLKEVEELRERSQNDRDLQVCSAIRLLLQAGANVHTKNNLGEGLLHHLFQDSFHRRLFGMRASYYHSLLPEIIRVAELLMQCGINVNDCSDLVGPPMTWFTEILCSMELNEVETTWPEIFFAYKMFCKYGVNPNLEDEKGISIVSLLLTAINRWLSQCTTPSDSDKAYCLLVRMQELLDAFFKHGLQPSDELIVHSTKQIAMLCNISLSSVSLFAGIRDLLATCFRYGINPNSLQLVGEMIEEPGCPCPLNAQFYLARAFMMHNTHCGMSSFFSLFQETLEQESLNRMIRVLTTILTNNFQQNQNDSHSTSVQVLWSCSRQPRSLKVLSKVRILASLGFSLERKLCRLPLPPVMLRYLSNFTAPCSGF